MATLPVNGFNQAGIFDARTDLNLHGSVFKGLRFAQLLRNNVTDKPKVSCAK
jgi:hypothetical protein